MNEPWFSRRSETERRKGRARFFYDFEMECRKHGWGDPAFVYDDQRSWSAGPTAASPSAASTPTGGC